MFVHSHSLEHILPTEAYYSLDWFSKEQDCIFRPQWTFFCTVDDVRHDGDRFAGEVQGHPVVVINRNDKLHALRNVCAHRHSEIVRRGCTHGTALKCQIHGWEYDESGDLTKITDGRSFHGFKAQGLCLQSFRVERAGDLVFVCLDQQSPSLREHLGAFADEFEQYYTNIRRIDLFQVEAPVNWKVIAENAVESYHVPMIHPNTYQDYRAEELHDHRLEATYSRYCDLMSYQSERTLESYGFRFYTWLLIQNPNYRRFAHVHWYPNSMLYFGDIFRAFNVLTPLGPERTRLTFHSFAPRAIHGGWLGRLLQDLSLAYFLRVGKRIVNEDLSFWPPVQRGIKHSPFRGILSCREERVYGIQRYVAEKMGLFDSITPNTSTT